MNVRNVLEEILNVSRSISVSYFKRLLQSEGVPITLTIVTL